VGSNPTLSAIPFVIWHLQAGDTYTDTESGRGTDGKPGSQPQTALNYFLESCSKPSVEAVDRRDLLKFSAFLRDEKDQAPRTVYNKFEHVMTFLKAQGIRGLVGKKDWPRFTEEEPEIYEREEVDKLLKVCDGEEQLWFEFFLMTGMREQEVIYTYWSDVNLSAGTVRVTDKPDRGWTAKAYKEREIPIPSKLVKSLKAWNAKSDKTCNYCFLPAGASLNSISLMA
jgi:integrase